MQVIEEKNIIDPKPAENWRIIPEEWVKNAKSREFSLLFGK
jgi:hypothetical protein